MGELVYYIAIHPPPYVNSPTGTWRCRSLGGRRFRRDLGNQRGLLGRCFFGCLRLLEGLLFRVAELGGRSGVGNGIRRRGEVGGGGHEA